MRLGAIPQNFKESIALVTGLVPTPLMDTLVALLLAKTIMAATAVGIFHVLERDPLTADEIAKHCGTDPRATKKLPCSPASISSTERIVSRWPLLRVAGYRGTPSVLCIRPSCTAIWICVS